jgi:tetratricopeptide (TPR) repeat protein
MQPIESPDNHHCSAADGWLDLGAPAEAELELAKVSAASLEHPAVMGLQWRILAVRKRWLEAVAFARRIVALHSGEADGWIHQSYALHELGRTQEAFDLLHQQAARFPGIMTIPYNLACYCCKLEQLDQARQWLRQAVQVSDKAAIRSMALKDSDMQPLWAEIQAWEMRSKS